MQEKSTTRPTKKQARADIVHHELLRLFPTAHTILQFSNHIELLIAVMLSAQTTDTRVNIVTKKLFATYPTLDDYLSVDIDTLTQDIASINYYRTKARHISNTLHIIKHTYHGILPRTVENMMMLPGVGRKTALVVLGNAYGIVSGIAVDTHVNRLARAHGLTTHTTPERIESDLQKLFPRDEWFHLTNRMIAYGRTYCQARCTHVHCPIMHILKKKGLC